MDLKAPIQKLVILTFIWLLSAGSINAQGSIAYQVDEMLETAIEQMNEGNYQAANLTFRKILKLDAVLPDDLSYLFAETLYMVDQYHNSRSFVDKYIRLAGPTGQYYSQAMDLKMYLDEEYEAILICKLCDHRGYRLSPCNVCEGENKITNPCFYCRGVGINQCEVCKGQGVRTTLSAFGETHYQTCDNCQGKGQTVCKLCHGEKTLSDACPSCHGTGNKASTQICDHLHSTAETKMTVEQ